MSARDLPLAACLCFVASRYLICCTPPSGYLIWRWDLPRPVVPPASVLSAKEATGHLVFAALANTNIAAAASAVRQRLPAAEIIMLADLIKATGEPDPLAIKAARTLRCKLAIPEFGSDRPSGAKGFNDMAALHGHDSLREAINGCDFVSAATNDPITGHSSRPDMTIIVSRRGEPAPMLAAEDEHGILRAVNVLGPVMTPWIESAARSKSAPVEYVAQTVIAAVSGVVGASRWIEARPGWQEPCITWHANVGDPSSNKSPAADPAAVALAAIERQWTGQHDEALRSHELKKVLVKTAREAWEDAVKKVQEEGLPPPPLPADAVMPAEPQRRRVKIADATTESVALILSGNPGGVVCFRGELAAFVGAFNKYGGGGDQAFWLETYGDRSDTVDRKKQGGHPINVEHIAVAIVGGIQPERLESIILAGEDDGFAARFLYSWPAPIPREWEADSYDLELLERVLTRLASLEFERVERDDTGQPTRHVPRVLRLSQEAAASFSAWWKADQGSAIDAEGLVKSAYGKGPGQVLRLALVIELMTWAAGPEGKAEPVSVSLTSIEAALHLVENHYRPTLLRVLGDAAKPKRERNAAKLAREILKRCPTTINARDVYRNWGISGVNDAESTDEACIELVEGWMAFAQSIARWRIVGTQGEEFQSRSGSVRGGRQPCLGDPFIICCSPIDPYRQ